MKNSFLLLFSVLSRCYATVVLVIHSRIKCFKICRFRQVALKFSVPHGGAESG